MTHRQRQHYDYILSKFKIAEQPFEILTARHWRAPRWPQVGESSRCTLTVPCCSWTDVLATICASLHDATAPHIPWCKTSGLLAAIESKARRSPCFGKIAFDLHD